MQTADCVCTAVRCSWPHFVCFVLGPDVVTVAKSSRTSNVPSITYATLSPSLLECWGGRSCQHTAVKENGTYSLITAQGRTAYVDSLDDSSSNCSIQTLLNLDADSKLPKHRCTTTSYPNKDACQQANQTKMLSETQFRARLQRFAVVFFFFVFILIIYLLFFTMLAAIGGLEKGCGCCCLEAGACAPQA